MVKKLFYAVLLLAMTPFFVLGGPSPVDPPTVSAVLNLGHVVYFALATVLVWTGVPSLRRRSPWRSLAGATLLALFLGLLIEGVQSSFARDPDWHDLWRNILGVWLAWFVILRPPMRGSRTALAITGACLVVELVLVAQAFVVEWRIQTRLPVIADFEAETEAANWSANTERSRDVASTGEWSLKVQLDTTKYSGTSPRRFPRDWRGWRFLALDVFNPEPDTLALTLIVADREHYHDGYRYENRFNRRVWAEPGWNHVRIALEDVAAAPEERSMDLAEVVTLGIFATRLPRPRIIYLDDLRLE